MNVSRVQRLCSVKGCKNTASYAITRTKEYGGVIICKKCLKEAYEAAEAAEKAGVKKIDTTPKVERKSVPLFYHPELTRKDEPQNETNEPQNFVCPECGKICANAGSLATHMRVHEKGGEAE